ncbi:Dehydrogenase patE, partial [Colletotrichum shisoi]
MRLSRSFLLPTTLALPLLDSILDPITNSVWSTLDGVVQTTLGGLTGILGTRQAYDYVVVGGGTVGNTIAYWLAEAGFTVVVVEAGLSYEVGKPIAGPVPLGDVIGVGSNPLDTVPTVDYGLKTVPQAGAGGREMHYAQGKCLGGSSAPNFMIHHRPNRGALDAWAEAVGDDSYTFDQFLPYFKKSFTFTSPNTVSRLANATTTYDESDFNQPSSNSPIQVTYPNWTSVWSTWVAKGLEALGMNRTDQYDKGVLSGYHYAQTTIHLRAQVLGSPVILAEAVTDYGLTRTGPLTSSLAEFLEWERMPSSANLS